MFFAKRLILFFIFVSPVRLDEYKLVMADFNMGDTVYETNVVLSVIGEKTYKITSSEGEQTFKMWDFVTMLGSFAEFDTFDSNPQVWCIFETPLFASDASWSVKENLNYGLKFPLHSVVQVFDSTAEYTATNIRADKIIGGSLYEEIRNRFTVLSRRSIPVMIFSAGHFNLSRVLPRGRILLVVQVYDIEKQDIVMLKFSLKFRSTEIAEDFYDYVTQTPSLINALIPVVM